MTHDDDFLLTETLPKIIDKRVHVGQCLLKGRRGVLRVLGVIPEIRPAAAPLIPADEGVPVGQLVGEAIRDGGIRRGRTAVEIKNHRIGCIPAGHQHILLLSVERKIDFFIHAVYQVGIML